MERPVGSNAVMIHWWFECEDCFRLHVMSANLPFVGTTADMILMMGGKDSTNTMQQAAMSTCVLWLMHSTQWFSYSQQRRYNLWATSVQLVSGGPKMSCGGTHGSSRAWWLNVHCDGCGYTTPVSVSYRHHC